MSDLHRTIQLQILFILTLGFIFSPQSNHCFAQDNSDIPKECISPPIGSASNTPLAPFQCQLLDLAFETANSIPVNPYGKDRARIQEEIVAICLRLGQFKRAAGYIESIENWRRGSCFADLAFECARQGCMEDAQSFLNRAESIIETTNEWRKDRIRVRIAQTYILLGQAEKAEEFEKGAVDSELGKVTGVRAMVCAEDSFDEQMKALDELIAPGQYEVIANAMKSCAHLFNRFYADPHRRSLVENKIEQSWDKLPIIYRIELLMEMAGYALDRSDCPKALELVNKAQTMMEGSEWPLNYRISLAAKLSEFRFQAGDKPKARSDLDRAHSLMDEQSETIVDIYRAGTLRPLAQAYRTMRDDKTSLEVYKQAVEEGVKNPNSRPRADDLAATCASMALNAIEPDTQIWTRIHQIREGLGQPW
jgi:tetratricopeptide (TPR) repeat protein